MELIEYKEMREAIVRVRELHFEEVIEGSFTWCNNCHFHYPCPTIKVLDGK